MKLHLSRAAQLRRRCTLRAAMLLVLSSACAAHAMDPLPSAPHPTLKPVARGSLARAPEPSGKIGAPQRTLKLPARGAVPAAKTVPVTRSPPAIRNRAPATPRTTEPALPANSTPAQPDPAPRS